MISICAFSLGQQGKKQNETKCLSFLTVFGVHGSKSRHNTILMNVRIHACGLCHFPVFLEIISQTAMKSEGKGAFGRLSREFKSQIN